MTHRHRRGVSSVKAHLGTSLFRNTYLLITMRVLGTGFGFFFWAFAGRLLPAKDVGFAAGVVSASVLLAGFAQLGLGYGLVRHLPASHDPKNLVNSAFVMSGLAGFAFALVFLLGVATWSPALLPLRESLAASLIFIALTLSTTLTQMLHWAFLATRKLIYSLIKQVSQSVFAVAALVLFRLALSADMVAVLAYTLATVLSLSWALLAFLPAALPGYRLGAHVSFSLRSRFANYSLKSFVLDQFSRLSDTLLPLMALNQFGVIMGGHFFIVWTIGRIVVAAASVALSLFAEGASQPAKALSYMQQSLRWGLVVASGLALALIVSGQSILSLIGPAYAEAGAGLLTLVALAGIPETLVYVIVGYLRVQDRLGAVFTVLMLDVGGGLLLSYLAMLRLGLIGAGWGWLVSQVLALAAGGVWLYGYRWRSIRGVHA